MEILKDKESLRNICQKITQSKAKLSLVPTMGMLHAGHLSLIDAAFKHSPNVLVSIFINPKQFNNQSDFEQYPSDIEHDLNLLKKKGVGYVYMPKKADFYRDNFAFDIKINHLADSLCGVTRPGHMNGVCVVLLKLLNLIRPDFAFFGEKDYQQLQIIKNLALDFDLDTQIIGCKTAREASGLAMSSRNKRLSEYNLKQIAPILYESLLYLKNKILNNEPTLHSQLIEDTKAQLLNQGFSKIDYLEILNSNLTKYDPNIKDARIFIAAWLEDVRLIDNLSL